MTMSDMMTSHLLWRNLSLGWIGLTVGACAISGVLGTFVFGWSSKRYRFGTRPYFRSDTWACLSVPFISTSFMSNGTISPTMLVVGVVVRRMGLHSTSLAISQLNQRTVHVNVRGTVGGSQHSMTSCFLIFQFGLGIILADPSQFYILCSIGYLAVVAAFFLMLQGVYLSDVSGYTTAIREYISDCISRDK